MTQFLADHILLNYTFRIIISFICGFAMGLERRIKNHAVGIRTLVLMTVSASLLSILSIEMADAGMITGDPTRIAAGVITGIGFIGAGVILRQGFNIRGITTAAIIFSAAGLGMSIGAGVIYPAILTFAIIMTALVIFDKLERKIFPAENTKILHFVFDSTDIKEDDVSQIIKSQGIVIIETDIDFSVSENKTAINYMVKTPKNIDFISFAQKFKVFPTFNNFSMTRK